jgi:hypothetical protein
MDRNVKSGITNSWRTEVNLSLTKKKKKISGILCSDTIYKLPETLLVGMP